MHRMKASARNHETVKGGISGLSLIQTISSRIIHISDKFIRKVKSRTFRLHMNLYKHRLYLLEQHGVSFKIWSESIRINTEGKSLILKLDPGISYME